MGFNDYIRSRGNGTIPPSQLRKEYNHMRGYDIPLAAAYTGGGRNIDQYNEQNGINNSVVDNYIEEDYVE